jgi:hypothetical protein
VSASLDEEIVAGWLEPVELPDMLAALRDAGFSGDVYRGCFADLHAMLEDEKAGALHFLRHGFAEGRIFRIDLDIGGLHRLSQLPARNRFYLRNLLVALAVAWTGSTIRGVADLAAHGAAIEQFRAMGAVPFLVLGDASADLYRRGASSGDRWICPLAMAPLEGGIEELLRTPPDELLPPDSDQHEWPVIWKFGQLDMQAGYLAYRLRHGIGPNDMDAFHAYAAPVVESYAAYLANAVPAKRRFRHWIAGLFPPVWLAPEHDLPTPFLQAEFGPDVQHRITATGADRLLDRTAMYQSFNRLLEKTVTELGFNKVRDFDCLLTPYGTVDENYVRPRKELHELDYRATRGILSTSIWNVVDNRPSPATPGSIREQFAQLLLEIRRVQTGEAG